MVIFLVIVFILILFWFICFTPYPFVWLLRSKKEEPRDKSPENIEEIKEDLILQKNQKYQSKYPNATYDLYMPKMSSKHLILWVHGGAFISGTSEGMKNYGPMLAGNGYVVVAMNYAYAPEHSFPTQIKQVDEMLVFIKNKYPNIEDVVLGGDSAGANIVASYASFYRNDECPIKIELKNVLDIRGLLLYCGPYDFMEDYQKEEFKKFKTFMKYIGWSYLGHKNWEKRNEKLYASPLHNIHKNYPPAYLCDGKKYSFMWQGKKLEAELKRNNIYVRSRFYEEMPHEFQFEYRKFKEEANQVYIDSIQFLKTILSEEK